MRPKRYKTYWHYEGEDGEVNDVDGGIYENDCEEIAIKLSTGEAMRAVSKNDLPYMPDWISAEEIIDEI